MYRLIILTLTFLLLISISKAQSQVYRKKIDSLYTIQKNSTVQDFNQVKRYSEIYKAYIGLRMDDSVHFYIDRTVKLASELNLNKYVAEAYYWKAFYYQNEMEYEKAETYYNYALNEYFKLNIKNSIADIYQNLSAMYVTIPDFVKALDKSFKAVEIFIELKDEDSLAACYFNIGNIYKNLKQFTASIEYFNKANNIFKKDINATYGSAITALNLGEAYFAADSADFKELKLDFRKRSQIAFQEFQKSLNLSIKHEYVDLMSNNYRLLGDIHLKLNQNEYAYSSYKKSLELSANIVSKNEYIKNLISISKYYISVKNLEKAKGILNDAVKLAEQYKILECTKDSYQLLSEISADEKDFNSALKYFKSFIKVKELIMDQDKQKEITRKQLQLDYTIKEKDLLAQQTITNSKFEKQLLLAKQRQQQLQLKEQELELADRQKNIDRLNYLNNKKELEQNHSELNQRHLKLKIDQLNRLKKINDQEDQINNNRYITIGLSFLVTAFAIGLFLIYRTHAKTKRLNRLVQIQKDELEQLNLFKDRIFTVISHDMTTPVNSVVAFMQLLELKEIDSKQIKQYAKKLNISLNYTSNMMLNLLNWASSQMEGHKQYIEVFQVEKCVNDVLNQLESTLSDKNISIIKNSISGFSIKSDYNMVSLILRNLINNALKFTLNGGEIQIMVHQINDSTIIKIIDNGIGISKELVDYFNNTEHGSLATTMGTNREKGTGLGLILCKNFASLLNGRLTLESEKDVGSTFNLLIPNQ